jgi:hypothetical protein
MIMIVRRRTWLYRLAGQRAVQSVTFKQALTAAGVKEMLRKTVGMPLELWGRTSTDPLTVRYY